MFRVRVLFARLPFIRLCVVVRAASSSSSSVSDVAATILEARTFHPVIALPGEKTLVGDAARPIASALSDGREKKKKEKKNAASYGGEHGADATHAVKNINPGRARSCNASWTITT